jgi:hypothetical protein
MVKTKNLLEAFLPSLADTKTYLTSAFEVEKETREVLLKHGLFLSVSDLELAICTAYTLARRLPRTLIQDNTKLIIVEPEKRSIPTTGIALAAMFGVNVHCIGTSLKIPKLSCDYYNKILPLISVSTKPLDDMWPVYDEEHVIAITYGNWPARMAWFRINAAKGTKHVMFIGDEKPKAMACSDPDEESSWLDHNFKSCTKKIVCYWKDSAHAPHENTTPSEDQAYSRHD